MRFPIDAVFVDSGGTVRKALSLSPHRMSPFVLRARDVIELPEGTIARTGTSSGDRLDCGILLMRDTMYDRRGR